MKDKKDKGRSKNKYSNSTSPVSRPGIKSMVSFRLNSKLISELNAAAAAGHYAPTMTAIVERGIELALLELKQEKKTQ